MEAKMKYPTFLVKINLILALTAPLLNGCAILSFLNLKGDSSEADEISEDPIASAAAMYRRPAGNLSESAQIAGDDEDYNPYRNAPPEEITLGMRMSDVVAIWGEPRDIETAGHANQGNQRWTYYQGLSSRWSMSATRIVYFEQGKVAGWEN